MLAVVKTPRTNMQMRGFIPPPVLRVLRHEFGKDLTVTPEKDDEILESVFNSSKYLEFKKRVSPGDYLRTYRENAGLTQSGLAEKIGVMRSYVCDLEHGRRVFRKQCAKKLLLILRFPLNILSELSEQSCLSQ
jgi:DNA-binding XRE family transcriptional regulator